jgi:uncharacterized protein HemX
MGWLDITLGAEDAQTLVGAGMFIGGAALSITGVGAVAGAGLMVGGAGMMASGQQAKNTREQQEDAMADQKAEIEKNRYESLLRQVSAEIAADQSVLATLDRGSNNNGNGGNTPSVNTQQNKPVGSQTSGTF